MAVAARASGHITFTSHDTKSGFRAFSNLYQSRVRVKRSLLIETEAEAEGDKDEEEHEDEDATVCFLSVEHAYQFARATTLSAAFASALNAAVLSQTEREHSDEDEKEKNACAGGYVAKHWGSKGHWQTWAASHLALSKAEAGRRFDATKGAWRARNTALMRALLVAKFTQNPALGALLLSTGHTPLHEVGRGSGYWILTGDDMMGQLLGAVRADLARPR